MVQILVPENRAVCHRQVGHEEGVRRDWRRDLWKCCVASGKRNEDGDTRYKWEKGCPLVEDGALVEPSVKVISDEQEAKVGCT
jgi:hypothetical protein